MNESCNKVKERKKNKSTFLLHSKNKAIKLICPHPIYNGIFFFPEKQSTSIRIGNLAVTVERLLLKETLSVFGRVHQLYYKMGTGFALAMFDQRCDAANALKDMNGKLMSGSFMVTSWADENEELNSDTGRFISGILISKFYYVMNNDKKHPSRIPLSNL